MSDKTEDYGIDRSAARFTMSVVCGRVQESGRKCRRLVCEVEDLRSGLVVYHPRGTRLDAVENMYRLLTGRHRVGLPGRAIELRDEPGEFGVVMGAIKNVHQELHELMTSRRDLNESDLQSRRSELETARDAEFDRLELLAVEESDADSSRAATPRRFLEWARVVTRSLDFVENAFIRPAVIKAEPILLLCCRCESNRRTPPGPHSFDRFLKVGDPAMLRREWHRNLSSVELAKIEARDGDNMSPLTATWHIKRASTIVPTTQ